MDNQADSTALRASLAKVRHPISTTTRKTLRAVVCEHVDRLRDLGWPPERVIVDVKRIARDAGFYPTNQVWLPGKSLPKDDALLVDIVAWCIERYYYRPE